MAVDTSISPYFDDFDENKNYVKVLFKPGVAVQSRELTTTQSILQNQIKSVGNYLFKDGSKVTGPKPALNVDARTIRLKPLTDRGEPINVNDFLDTYVTSTDSEVLGLVEFVYLADDPNIGDPPTVVMSLKRFNTTNDGLFPAETELNFYNDYTDALNKTTPNYVATTAANITKNAISTTSAFSTTITFTNPTSLIEVGDRVVHPSITKNIYVTQIVNSVEIEVNESPGATIGGENISFVKEATCPTTILTQDDAVFYKDGYFVKTTVQKIVPDKNTSFPTKMIALFSDQQIITSNDDASLLDPALESSNYFATGADRLQIELTLASLDLNSDNKLDNPEDVIPLLNFNKGSIEYITEITTDAALDQKLAERTYDESGSYVVNPFRISPQVGVEESNTMIFSVSEGKAYIGGQVVRTVDTTEIVVPKNFATETRESYNINTNQGSYLKVANVRNNLPVLQEIRQGEVFLELHSNVNPSSSSFVGTIAVKNIEYDSYIGNDISPQLRIYYHFYSPLKESPATWERWSQKYNISSAEGQFIANVLYTNNGLLGNYGAARTPFYGLFREPDTEGVAFWWNRWNSLGKDIAKVKEEFATSILPTNPDYNRVRSNAKSFLTVVNNSVFFDGLVDVNKIKSIVGVSNGFTSHATGATYNAPFFYAQIADGGIDQSTGQTIIFDKDRRSDRLVFPINKSYVDNIDRIQTTYSKVIKNAIFSSGTFSKSLAAPETFAVGDGLIPASTARANFIILIKSGATANIGLGVFNFETGSVTCSADASTITFDVGDPGFTGLADISYVIENDDIAPRIKTLNRNQTKFVTIERADFPYSIAKSDIAYYNGIWKVPNVGSYLGNWTSSTSYDYNDIVVYESAVYTATLPTQGVSPIYANAWSLLRSEDTADYILDTGQRDTIYDHGQITYIGRANPPGDCLVNFDYFTHSGEGPCTVQSYPENFYGLIPIYRSTVDSLEFNLRDCLDFRPRRKDDWAYQDFEPAVIPNATVLTEADVTYYIGRRDRIYVTSTLDNFASPYNKFYLEIGTDSASPREPTDNSDFTRLSLAVLEIPPYSINAFDVKINYDDNRRFTMKDIAKIEDMTLRLDKVVRLQSVEINNLRAVITNDQGETLLKSGILVEDFSSTDKLDLTGGFSAVIDSQEQECFPAFNSWNIDLELQPDSDIFTFNDIITMKYEEEIFVSNLEGNNTVNVNPGGVDDGRGRAQLSKKNSYSINLFLTGGLFVAGVIAAKTLAAYQLAATVSQAAFSSAFLGAASPAASLAGNAAAMSAYAGESILAVTWEATKALGQSFWNAIPSIDAITKYVSSGWTNIATSASEIYSWVSTGGAVGGTAGASSVVVAPYAVGGRYAVGAVTNPGTFFGPGGFGEAAWTYAEAGWSQLSSTLSNVFSQPISATYNGVIAGLNNFVAAASTAVFGSIAAAANTVAASLAGVPILGTASAAIASGATAFAGWIAAAPVVVQIVAVVAVIYVAVKVVQKVWKWVKKLFSDVRMKENIKLIKRMPNGLNLYEFEYKKEFKEIAGHGKFQGVLADEAEKLYPRAVQVESNGYKSVNYSLLGM